ncbi:hypothetical protein CCR75_000859 [Bremia lactucae]|uniref:Uncharacterized protein n=1 Tax=Bremia lactucae TaxID=4779 RepID=A0A976FNI5_BRELC|nr:hypothetical protein CCR75_000859 [Bremia lactucae]
MGQESVSMDRSLTDTGAGGCCTNRKFPFVGNWCHAAGSVPLKLDKSSTRDLATNTIEFVGDIAYVLLPSLTVPLYVAHK